MTPPALNVWPPLPPSAYARPRRTSGPFPLGNPHCRLVARARHGLWLGVQAIGLRHGDVVLMPAWHHGSEVEALERAGLRCVFYEPGAAAAPDPAELERLLGPRVRALYVTHYLGFPQESRRWRRWCDDRGLLLIEDAAQAWLASTDDEPVGSFGQLAVFCLYKTFGFPDGSAVVAQQPVDAGTARPRLGALAAGRRHAAWLAGRSAALTAAGGLRRRGTYDPAKDFALGDVRAAATLTSRFLIARMADVAAAATRRRHYRLLLERLAPCVAPPFQVLPDGASPFAFPLETDDKPGLLAALADDGVRALDFWSTPHPSLPADRFPDTARRRARTVCLPVHQELRERDLERIAAAAGG